MGSSVREHYWVPPEGREAVGKRAVGDRREKREAERLRKIAEAAAIEARFDSLLKFREPRFFVLRGFFCATFSVKQHNSTLKYFAPTESVLNRCVWFRNGIL